MSPVIPINRAAPLPAHDTAALCWSEFCAVREQTRPILNAARTKYPELSPYLVLSLGEWQARIDSDADAIALNAPGLLVGDCSALVQAARTRKGMQAAVEAMRNRRALTWLGAKANLRDLTLLTIEKDLAAGERDLEVKTQELVALVRAVRLRPTAQVEFRFETYRRDAIASIKLEPWVDRSLTDSRPASIRVVLGRLADLLRKGVRGAADQSADQLTPPTPPP